jgi:hypothetical protein
MSIIISVLNDELDRNQRTQLAYQKELSQYFKGSLVVKKRKSIDYFYLAYRDSKGQIKTDYIGNIQSIKVNEVQQQIQKRKEILSILKDLKKDELTLRKMLRLKD